jgi:carboxyl-terminal processing protease
MGWAAAFAALHSKLSQEYAFSEWRSVNWDALRARYQRPIQSAERRQDKRAFETALRGYLFALSDGGVRLEGADAESLSGFRVAGSFGLAIATLNDRRVIAIYVAPRGPAARAGLRAGAVLLAWNDLPVQRALDRVSVLWRPENRGVATAEHQRLEQHRLLARGPVGSVAAVVFRNPGSTAPRRVELRAMDDRGAGLGRGNFAQSQDLNPPTVAYRMLPGGIGYVRVKAQVDLAELRKGTTDPLDLTAPVFEQFRDGVAVFVREEAPGIIVDLRGNLGGSSELAAQLAGFFSSYRLFFERQRYFNALTGQFEERTLNDAGQTVEAIYVEPQGPQYSGQVVVLVNPATTGSGQALAAAIQGLSRGMVLGFYGTSGSGGLASGVARLPGDLTVAYPCGQSLDLDGRIQFEARGGQGGVTPDVRIALSEEMALGFGAGRDVELEQALRTLEYLLGGSQD